jgi:hypothetical protein
MIDHLGHGKNEPVENPAGNTRNGKSKKTLKGEFGELPIEIPRDRHGTFEPLLIPKHQTRWTGFDDKILSLYARGMTVTAQGKVSFKDRFEHEHRCCHSHPIPQGRDTQGPKFSPLAVISLAAFHTDWLVHDLKPPLPPRAQLHAIAISGCLHTNV